MKKAFRYNRRGSSPARKLCGYARWLRFWAEALARPRACGAVWAEDADAGLLAAGFPALLAVPAPLFTETAELFPGRCRLAAEGKDAEALLAAIRDVEARFSLRFDWDAFLAACERRDRRGGRLRTLSRALAALAPPPVDARTPQTALRSLSERKREI